MVIDTESQPRMWAKRNRRPRKREQLKNKSNADTLNTQDILDCLPFYVLLVDENHYIIAANTAVQNHLGVEPEDVIGKYCPKAIHGINEPFPGCPLEEVVRKGKPIEREVFDDQSGRWLLSAVYPTDCLTKDKKRIFLHMVSDITQRKEAEEQNRTLLEQFESLSAHLESIREQERERISRDLHDDTCQMLASIIAYTQAAKSSLPVKNKTRSMLDKVSSTSIQALDTIQSIIYELRPIMLTDLGLIASINEYVQRTFQSEQINVSIETIGRQRRLNSKIETTAFRVIQEAVQNIRRHAQCQNVNIYLNFKKGSITVSIIDDGIGFDFEEAIRSKDRPRGLGLLGMKERVEILNGSFRVSSHTDGRGTKIEFNIPYNQTTLKGLNYADSTTVV